MGEAIRQLDVEVFNFLNSSVEGSAFEFLVLLLAKIQTWTPFFIFEIFLVSMVAGKRIFYYLFFGLGAFTITYQLSTLIMAIFESRFAPFAYTMVSGTKQVYGVGNEFVLSMPDWAVACITCSCFFTVQSVKRLSGSKMSFIFLLIPAIAGVCRVTQGLSFPTDVFAGYFLGAFMGSVFSLFPANLEVLLVKREE